MLVPRRRVRDASPGCSSTTFIDGMPGARRRSCSPTRPRPQPEEAGARPAILATLYLAVLLLVIAVPIGVATAIYLEEYAHKERWYNRAARAQHPEPRRRAGDRLRDPRARVHRPRASASAGSLLAGATHPHARRPADRDRRVARGDPRRPGLDPPGRASRSARRSGRSSGGRSSRPRSRASRPARSSRSRARSARRRR